MPSPLDPHVFANREYEYMCIQTHMYMYIYMHAYLQTYMQYPRNCGKSSTQIIGHVGVCAGQGTQRPFPKVIHLTMAFSVFCTAPFCSNQVLV